MIQNVWYFEKCIFMLDNNELECFIIFEKKNVLVDFYIKWCIIDLSLYYILVSGDEVWVKMCLNQIVNVGLCEEFGKCIVYDVVFGECDKIMEQMCVKVDNDVCKIGVQIVDVCLKCVELLIEVSEVVYCWMEVECK